ncbi:BatD family protein [Paraferrimonas sp. SM1919]|uniref:BatD family protein n=1 Tax=Paraferrimonas sp. SM1919 TaxID=2662263 RepID=UPI0013D69CCC|nr:BatD family protein [Paraferrimonas sp. SM1919]
MVRALFIAAILWITAISQAYAALQATVSDNPVLLGQPFTLTITSDDNVDSGDLDLTILEKDFIVGRTNVRRSTQIVNFSTTKTTTWQTTLIADELGSITIPALKVGNQMTQPINLQVTKDKRDNSKKLAFLETSVSQDSAYIGQIINYKAKLFLRAQLNGGSLQTAESDLKLQQLGEDSDNVTSINGVRYRIIERNWAVTLTEAGQIELPQVVFDGTIVQGNRGFGFADTKSIRAVSPKTNIKVLDKPSSYQGDWLVADILELQVEQGFPTQVTQGEPISLKYNIIAVNADSEALSTLPLALPDSFRSYPESPEVQTNHRNGNVISQLSQTYAIIATKPGTYVLPEVKIPWFSTQQGKQQWLTVPAQTIEVLVNNDQPLLLTPNNQTETVQVQPTTETKQVDNSTLWPWQLALALMTVAWLITLVLLVKRPKIQQASNTEPNKLAQKYDFKMACKQDDLSAILTSLPYYLDQQLGGQLSLAQRCRESDPLAKLVQSWQQAKYGPKGGKHIPGKQIKLQVDQWLKQAKQLPKNEFKLNP